jgi:UDP-N-acetylmuramoylalanine--D-glutamate ligase
MVLNRDDDWSMANGRCGRKMVTFGLNAAPRALDFGLADGAICKGNEALVAVDALKLSGLHNAANAMAALALCEALGVESSRLVESLKSFAGLPHRVETVAEINGVIYVDDSKGTNVGATLAAIEGMGRKVAIVLGGEGKGQDFSPLKVALEKHGRAIALIGRDAAAIGMALEGSGVPTRILGDMADGCALAGCPSTSQAIACCSRRPAPALICTVITRIGLRLSSTRCRDLSS